MDELTAEEYEDRARRCHQLTWSCTDPMALDTFKRLARDYNLIAAAIRARGEADRAAFSNFTTSDASNGSRTPLRLRRY
jgi:hypothetical protein